MKKILAASTTAFIASAMLAIPAWAVVNPSPVLPHSIISFPERDFVSADGYGPGQKATVNVVRGGVTIGTSGEFAADSTGLVEVNHPGGGCWVGNTPDILPGDVIQVMTAPDTGDATTTADVRITQTAAETSPGSGTVVIKGTATMADGTTPIDLAQLEVRLVANKQAFVLSGNRTLRADGTSRANGTLAYDAPGSTSWTATFAGLDKVSAIDGISDADRALASENRVLWLGADPLAGNELTIFEVGGPTPATAGPAAPCTAPLARYGVLGSNAPAGGINGAFIAGKDLVLSGASQDATAVDVTLGDGTKTLAPVRATLSSASAAQSWSATIPRADVASLADGTLTATGSYTTASGTVGGSNLKIQKDTVPPKTPSVPDLTDASDTGDSNTDNLTKNATPTFMGSGAEAGSTVKILVDGAEKGSARVDGGGFYSVTTSALANGAHTVTATATDAAGNPSEPLASASLGVRIDTVAPKVTASPGSGIYGPTQKVALTSNEAAKIYYTRDQTIPDANDTQYTVPLSIPVNTVLKYVAVDTAGNQGQVATQTYQIDSAAPRIASRTPAPNAVRVALGTNVKATFNETVKGVSGTTSTLKKAGTTRKVAAVVTYSATTKTALLNPSANLLPRTKYTVTLTGGVKDSVGNPLAPISWSFTTR